MVMAGFAVGGIILAVLAVRNHEELEEIWTNLMENLSKTGRQTNALEENPVDMSKTGTIMKSYKLLESMVDTETNIVPIERALKVIPKNIRNLPNGYHASPEKVATALENGFDLLPGQTWVDEYSARIGARLFA